MKENIKVKIIENCLEKNLSRFEADKVLKSHGLNSLEGGEADCYDVLINSSKAKHGPRGKIIASSLMRGLSKTDVNIALYDAKFRRLTEDESEYYEDVLSRIRYCGKSFDYVESEIHKKEKIISIEEIIQDGIVNELSVSDINKILLKSGYFSLSPEKESEYKQRYNEYHNKRQSIIQHSYQELKSVSEVNRILQDNHFSMLSMVEELNYQKEKEEINAKKRDNLIKECIEENLEIYEINIVLNKNNYEKLSEQEADKILKEKLTQNKTPKKTTELSEQFRKLYRKATKQFHPDRYSNQDEKNKANSIMKELNEAKEKNDFFLLKDIVRKYENTLK